ncbi:hypothetical protein CKAH01_15606 [Colletotrichum kahawae]|uniref:Uncharacterized protein n=1 Tax=Colletotrichum kahawae TaxID=34407 RepID=A0AAD9YIE5_COLKA|nr:hypothetical protein CKAH01_15606 [Colletotrichum kahawae]
MAAFRSLGDIKAKYVKKQQQKQTAAAAAAAPNPFEAVTNVEAVPPTIQQSQDAVARILMAIGNSAAGLPRYEENTDYIRDREVVEVVDMCAPSQGYNNDVTMSDVPNAGFAMDIDDASYNSPDVTMSDVSDDGTDMAMYEVPYAGAEIHMSDAWEADSLSGEDHSDEVEHLIGAMDNKLEIRAEKTRAAGLPQFDDYPREGPWRCKTKLAGEDDIRGRIAAEISKSRATVEMWNMELKKIQFEVESGYADPRVAVKRKDRADCLLAKEWKRLDRLDVKYYLASRYASKRDECCVQ